MEYAGKEWFYNFRELPSAVSEKAGVRAVCKLRLRYAGLTKAWNVEHNTDWLCRHYAAATLIMAATLNINSMHYARDHNLRVVVPYLKYYAFLSIMRSVIMTIPEQNWDGGKLLTISHAQAITLCVDYISLFNKELAAQVEGLARNLKASRELISYRAPSSGDANVDDPDDFLSLCTCLVEVAQLGSELFESSLEKHADAAAFSLNHDSFLTLVDVQLEGHSFFDSEDAYRLGYFARKFPRATNILFMMREGHVEDFFGAWAEEDEDEAHFNPDKKWGVIFDIP